MVTSILLVDPITFKIKRIEDPNVWQNYTNKFLNTVTSRVKDSLGGKSPTEKLKIINDNVFELLDSGESEWEKIPSDRDFPGFFSSMADNAIATSAVGVAIAVELFNKVDLASEYSGKEMAELLGNRKGIIEVVRTLCLLHDAGKPSDYPAEKTKEAVWQFLTNLGFKELASELAESASRHYYEGGGTFSPKTKVEWIVAYAKRVAEQDRTFTGRLLSVVGQPLRWLHDQVEASDKEKVKQLADVVEKLGDRNIKNKTDEWEKVKEILPLDYDYIEKQNKELMNPSEKLGVDIKLALILLEGAGIQGYVTKSSSARHLVGRGSLVEVATRLAAKELEDMLAPESIIYVTSGSMFALVPPSELPKIVDALNKKFEEVVEGGISLKCCKSAEGISFNLFELKTGPKFTWANWEKESNLSRIGRRNFGEFYTILNNTISVLDGKVGECDQSIPAGEICSICFEERAVPENDPKIVRVRKRLPEDEREGYKSGVVCLNVDQHRMNLKDNLTNLLMLKFNGRASVTLPIDKSAPEEVTNSPICKITSGLKKFLEGTLNSEKYENLIAEFAGKSVIFESVKSWSLIGRQSEYALKRKTVSKNEEEKGAVFDIAFIMGDGDNFGLLKSAMNNLTLYRKVSKIFYDVIQNSIARALSEVILHQLKLYAESYRGSNLTLNKSMTLPGTFTLELPFDFVYYGGDDFLFVLDAGFIFIFLKAFREAVLDSLGSRKQNYDKPEDGNLSIFPLGISFSVVVAPNKAPIHGTLSALKTLEIKAKEFSKRRQRIENNKLAFGGEISVALERFTTIPSKEFVNENYNPKNFGEITKICNTAWPLLGGEIFSDNTSKENTTIPLIKLVKMLQEKKLKANNVAVFARVEIANERELKLRIKYKAARMKEKSPEQEGYKLLADNLTLKEDDCVKFRHRDIANVMRIIYDNPLLLPMEGDSLEGD
nr:hypothetical protein [Candidatus Freyarchaeota archaeon]